jgi:hypothetical protein
MAKGYAIVVGAVLLVVGILGFVKGDAGMMGMKFNTMHNSIHLLSGIIGLGAGFAGAKASRMFAQIFGVIYTLVAILGFAGVGFVVDMLMLNTNYNIIHIAVGLLGLLAGFTGSKEPASA